MTSVPRQFDREREIANDKLNYSSIPIPKQYGSGVRYNPISPHTSKNQNSKYSKFDLKNEEQSSLIAMQKNLEREKKMFLNFTGPIKLESDLSKE